MQPVSTTGGFRCGLNHCSKAFTTYKELKKHLSMQIDGKEVVECPFDNCNLKFKNNGSLQGHLSRVHSQNNPQNVEQYTNVPRDPSFEDSEALNFQDRVDTEEDAVLSRDSDITRQFNLFLVKLQVQNHVTQTVMDEIVKSFKYFHELSNEKLLSQCLEIAYKRNADFKGEEEIHKLFESDSLSLALDGPMRSQHKRLEYAKKNMKYVEPCELKFNTIDADAKCHYIPLKDSLKHIMSDKTVRNDFLHVDKKSRDTGVLADIQDGYVYKRNCPSERTVELILYQDSFEVVNPLGSARTVHKLLGVYYTLANLKPHNRSNVQSYQLIMLVKESVLKRFPSQLIFKTLINELEELTNEGFSLGFETKTKGRLLFILGDNLGSHYIGGFSESFSSNNFCRYCTIGKQEFVEGKALGDQRTPDSYDNDAKEAEEKICLVNGVKSNSPFNAIPSFHVATPALPPCIAHDLYEGVVAYDLMQFFKYFCNEKQWITKDKLNHCIVNFNYKSYDALDKPVKINFKTDKLSGHAIENLVLLRNVNLILVPIIGDYDDEVWKLLLTLREIVAYVSAPAITLAQVSCLKHLILDYLSGIKKCFPDHKLKPKHHYMMHYPELIEAFGPLSKCSTLRMENKHQFFKKSINRSCNFKNITKFSAYKHSLLQAYCMEGSLFQTDTCCDAAILYDKASLPKKMHSALQDRFGNINDDFNIVREVKLEGVQYKVDYFVVIAVRTRKFIFGKLLGVLLRDSLIYLILQAFDGLLRSELGGYFITQTQDYVIKSVDELADLMCVPSYTLHNCDFINTKYSLTEQ